MGNPGVIEVNECGGRWDLAVSFLAANASRFNKNLKELMNQNPSLKNYDVVTNAVSHRFPRKFLSEAPPVKGILIGGDREPLKISRRSALALAEILEDARKPLVEISARTGMNPKTVQSAISKLKDIGIVKGFLPVFGLHNIGYVRNRMFVKYHNLSPEREREFVSYCRQARNVTDVHKVLGAWDLEIDIESVPGKELREAIMSIREGFEDIIKESEVVEFFSLHKKSLLTRKALMESTSIEG
jgi:DNA-binding Lrp family transcriptional regulator